MTREEAINNWIIPAIKNTWNEKKCKEIIEALKVPKWISISEMDNDHVEHDTLLLDMRNKCNNYVHTIAQEGPIDMCFDDANYWNTCAFRFCPYLKKED